MPYYLCNKVAFSSGVNTSCLGTKTWCVILTNNSFSWNDSNVCFEGKDWMTYIFELINNGVIYRGLSDFLLLLPCWQKLSYSFDKYKHPWEFVVVPYVRHNYGLNMLNTSFVVVVSVFDLHSQRLNTYRSIFREEYE